MIDHPSLVPSSDTFATDSDGNAVTYGELLIRAGQQDPWAIRTLCEMNGTEPPEFARLPQPEPIQGELDLRPPVEFDTADLGLDEGPAPRRLPQ